MNAAPSLFQPFAEAIRDGHRIAHTMTKETELKDGNAVAVWLGFQPSYSSAPGFHLFNTTRPILKNGQLLPIGATVTETTLNNAGYSAPTIPAHAAGK